MSPLTRYTHTDNEDILLFKRFKVQEYTHHNVLPVDALFTKGVQVGVSSQDWTPLFPHFQHFTVHRLILSVCSAISAGD